MPSSSLIGKKRGRDHVTRATESTATISSSSFVKNNSYAKKDKGGTKTKSGRNSKNSEVSEEKEDNTPVVEDEPSGNINKSSAGGFGSALSKILARDIDNKANPVLSKRHTALQKLREKDQAEQEALKKQNKQRKLLRKSHNVDPRQAAPDFERQLRKVATKGVVALFNAIAKHQHSVEIAEQEANRTSEKVKIVAAKQASFLDLLKHGVQEQQNGTLSSKAITTSTTTLSSTKSGNSTNTNGKGGWSVLSDSMVNMAGKIKKSTATNNNNTKTNTASFNDDDDDDDNDIPDVLDSESDDNEY